MPNNRPMNIFNEIMRAIIVLAIVGLLMNSSLEHFQAAKFWERQAKRDLERSVSDAQ